NNYNLNGGTLTLGGNGRIDVDPGMTATISSTLAGSGGFRKVGPGTLVLTADMTNTGPKAIAGGIVSIDSGSRLGSAVGTLTIDDGTLKQTAAGSTTLINSNLGIAVGYYGATIDYNAFGGVATYGGTITGVGGTTSNGGSNTLIKTGLGELRYQ